MGLSFATVDGVAVAGKLYPVPAEHPPGLVLVHPAGADCEAWDPFACRAQRNGYLCLAFDLRGHGESVMRDGKAISYRNFDTAGWRAAVQDIAAAKQAIIDHGADPENIAIAGAGVGANLSLLYALEDPGVQGVILVSPGLDYKGVKIEKSIAGYGRRPALLVTSQGDSYAASSCTTLKRAASGLCELREYRGAAHGIAIFDAAPMAMDQVFLWLRPIIGPDAGETQVDAAATGSTG